MKKIKLIALLAVAVVASVVTSCRVAPSDWALDAQWQLMSVENAGTTVVPDSRTYWSFYRHTANLAHLKSDESGSVTVTANLTYVEDKTLTLEFPQGTPAALEAFGIIFPDSTDPALKPVTLTFDVNTLSGKRLVLTDQATGAVYTFRKF